MNVPRVAVASQGAGSSPGVARGFPPVSPGRLACGAGFSVHGFNVRRVAGWLLSLAVGACAGAAHASACDWNNPGAAPYSRTPVAIEAAIEAYSDIHPLARADLIARIKGLREDGIILITRDKITSPQGAASGLRDMHWRGGLCIGAVDRSGWPADRVEPALVYCSLGWCIAVPTVCGNIARVDFTPIQRPEPEYRRYDGGPVKIHHVPEPSSVLLVALALAVMRGVRA